MRTARPMPWDASIEQMRDWWNSRHICGSMPPWETCEGCEADLRYAEEFGEDPTFEAVLLRMGLDPQPEPVLGDGERREVMEYELREEGKS